MFSRKTTFNVLFAQGHYAALVENQSKEIMNLINVKRAEFMQAESLYIEDEHGETE